MKALKRLLLGMALFLCLFPFSSCGYSFENEDMTNTREWGEAVDITYSYDIVLLKEGPWKLRVVPRGVETLQIDGEAIDCVKISFENIGEEGDGSANYAHCTATVDLLTDDLDAVSYDAWYQDDEGTKVDVRRTELEPGVVYFFYIPLRNGLEESGLAYVTVSDRSNLYARSGSTYWYSVV